MSQLELTHIFLPNLMIVRDVDFIPIFTDEQSKSWRDWEWGQSQNLEENFFPLSSLNSPIIYLHISPRLLKF